VKPLIGITCNFRPEKGWNVLARDYARSVEEAGGIPLALPLVEKENREELLQLVHGLLFSGGGDIGSFHYGEEPARLQGKVYPPLDEHEIYLASRGLEERIPLLGICRGMQVLNVAAGGSLYQDLGEQRTGSLQHYQKMPRPYPVHTVFLAETSLLSRRTGETVLRVNSFHHQAVKDPAPAASVSAVSSDGVVEAVEFGGSSFAVGVQWHPENMSNAASRRLFQSLVKAAAGKQLE